MEDKVLISGIKNNDKVSINEFINTYKLTIIKIYRYYFICYVDCEDAYHDILIKVMQNIKEYKIR